jgi:pyruvate formate lyase activating enzyme
MTVDEVVAEAEADKLFYQNSGGGVTLSGGEPLYEWEFARQVLKACKQKSLHTALDTCGYAPWHAFEEVLQYVDLVLFDIKHMDPQRHKQGTGKSNSLILANAQKTASMVRTWLRAPLIPTYNDSEVHLREVAEFARKIGVEKLSLLPYHNLGEAKYEQMGRRYPLKREQIEAPNSQSLEQAKTLIEALGTAVTIGR